MKHSLEERLKEAYQDKPEFLSEIKEKINLLDEQSGEYLDWDEIRHEISIECRSEDEVIKEFRSEAFDETAGPYVGFFIGHSQTIKKMDKNWFNFLVGHTIDYNSKTSLVLGDELLRLFKKCPERLRNSLLSFLKNDSKPDYPHLSIASELFFDKPGVLETLDNFDFPFITLGKSSIPFLLESSNTGGGFQELERQIEDYKKFFFEKYILKRKIGEGGSRRAYLAIDGWSGEPTCIKIFKDEEDLPHQVRNLRSRYSLESILMREAKSLRRLTHPNLVRFYTAGNVGDLLYVEEEYIEGKNLRGMQPELCFAEKVWIFNEVLKGIDFLHNNNYIIRDLKLSNILVSNDKSTVKIDDLEFMKKNEEAPLNDVLNRRVKDYGIELLLDSPTLVSDRYAAPELRKGAKPSYRTDIYALGCMFYYLLTGERDTFEKLNVLPEKDYETALEKTLDKFSGEDFASVNLLAFFRGALFFQPRQRGYILENVGDFGSVFASVFGERGKDFPITSYREENEWTRKMEEKFGRKK